MADEIERCREWIENALEYSNGNHLFEDIVAGIIKGTFQLWPASKSCLVTEITQYPRKKVLHIFLAGGDLNEIKSMRDDVEAWAKAHGCDDMTMVGRLGWSKALKDIGWETGLVSMHKRID